MSSNRLDHLQESVLGAYGSEIVSGAAASTTSPFVALFVAVAATFTVLTQGSGTGTYTGIAFPAGTWIYGQISAFTISAGTVIAYRGEAT